MQGKFKSGQEVQRVNGTESGQILESLGHGWYLVIWTQGLYNYEESDDDSDSYTQRVHEDQLEFASKQIHHNDAYVIHQNGEDRYNRHTYC
jgi:hypothetical protein